MSVPGRVHAAPQAGNGARLGLQAFAALPSGGFRRPDCRHARAVDEHHRGVAVVHGQIAVAVEDGIEQFRGVGQIDLIHVVVDGAALTAREVRNGKTVVGKAGQPAAPPKARQVLHQMDFIGARRVADLFDGPDEHTLGAVLGRLRADEDADRRFRYRRAVTAGVQHDAFEGRHGKAGGVRQTRPRSLLVEGSGCSSVGGGRERHRDATHQLCDLPLRMGRGRGLDQCQAACLQPIDVVGDV